MNSFPHMDALARVIASLGSNSFGPDLEAWLRSIVSFDGFTMMLFNPRFSPAVLHGKMIKRDERIFWENYMQGIYLLDPFYRLCSTGQEGVFHMRDVAPHGFFSSSYYEKYYGVAGIIDEIDFIFQAHDQNSGMVAMTRTKGDAKFTKAECNRLISLTSVVLSLTTRHVEMKGALFENALPTFRPVLLQERLDRFGETELTGREYEIVHLMLRGYSSKAAANQLDISPATERTHRKSIYKKMAVNSHAELLASAFAFLLEDKTGELPQ